MQAAGPKFRVHFNPYENAIDDFMRCAGIVRPEEFRYPASRRPTNAGPASAGLIGGLCQGVHGFPLVPERRSGYSDAGGTISCPIAAPGNRVVQPGAFAGFHVSQNWRTGALGRGKCGPGSPSPSQCGSGSPSPSRLSSSAPYGKRRTACRGSTGYRPTTRRISRPSRITLDPRHISYGLHRGRGRETARRGSHDRP